jgi:hypothetical protein
MSRSELTEPVALEGSRQIRPISGLLFVLASLLALAFAADVGMLLVTGKGAVRRDFISYWAAGQQLAHHQDPYDATATLKLERALGYPAAGEALIVRNPPTALPLVAPLGYVNFRTAALLWSLLLVGCWIAAVRILWTMQGRPRASFRILGYRITPTFAVSLFAPALACIFYGQTALFALLGFCLFVSLHRSRPFLAGAALWLCALKPHLFLPFAVVLLLWVVVSRSYKVLVGAFAALAASALLAYLLDPRAWHEYSRMMHTVGLEREFIPCLSIALRFAIRPTATWLQYLPAVAGCMWAAIYYLRRRDRWQWHEDGALVVFVSMVLAPYAWLTDQVLAAPALLVAVRRSSLSGLAVLALLSLAIDVSIVVNLTMHSNFYLWTTPAWLAWYLFASHGECPVPPSS